MLTNLRTKQRARLYLNPPNIPGGMWHADEEAVRDAYRRVGAPSAIRGGDVVTDRTYRVVDDNGYCIRYASAEQD